MANLLEILVQVIDKASGPLRGIRGEVQDLGDSTNTVGKRFQKFGGNLTKFGRNMTTAVTLPVVGLGGAMLKTAADFESGMNKVLAITQATPSEFAALRAQAKKLGSETAFSATQAADAMAFFGASGYSTEQILSSMEPTLALAGATGTDLAATADMISNSFQAAGVPFEEFNNKAEAMAKLFSSANLGTDLTELGTQLSRVAGTAKGAGLDINETVAAIGVLGGSGQMASAGTNLGAIFRAFSDSKKSAALEQAGILVQENGKFRKFGDILTDINKVTGEMSEFKRSQFLTDVFGTEGARGMTALLDTLEDGEKGFKGLVEAANAAEGSGILTKMNETMRSGLTGELNKLRSAWEGFAIAIGDTGLLGAVADIVSGITGLVSQLANANPALLRFGVAIAAALAAAGPVAMVVGGAISAFGAILPILSALSPLAIAAATAASLLAAGFVLAGGSASDLQYVLPIIGQHLLDFPANVAAIPEALQSAFGALGSTFTLLKANIIFFAVQTKTAVMEAFSGLGEKVSGAIAAIGPAFASAAAMMSGAIATIQGAISGMIARFAAIPSAISGAISQAVGVVTGFAGRFAAAGKGLMDALVRGIMSGINAAIGAVQGAMSRISGLLPGSDAKWGPLSHLTAQGSALLPTFAKGIQQTATAPLAPVTNAIAPLVPALAPVTASVAPAPARAGGGGGDTFNIEINLSSANIENPRDFAARIFEEIQLEKERRDRLRY